LKALVLQMRKKVYSPEEIIYSPDRKPNKLLVIEKGKSVIFD
jgi:hypothetical protein